MKKIRKGVKDDSKKPDISLIPKEALFGMAEALMYGQKKYSRWNYRSGLEYSALISAAMRHLIKFNDGQDLDDESFLHHVDHAMSSLAMLKWMIVNMPEMDDRYKKPKNRSGKRRK